MMVGWLVAPLQNMYLDHSMVQVSGTALHFPSFPLWRSLRFSKHHLAWNSRTGTNSVSWFSDPECLRLLLQLCMNTASGPGVSSESYPHHVGFQPEKIHDTSGTFSPVTTLKWMDQRILIWIWWDDFPLVPIFGGTY